MATLIFNIIFLFVSNNFYSREDNTESIIINEYNVYVLTELSSCFTCEVSYLAFINKLNLIEDNCCKFNYTAFFSGNRNKDTLIFKKQSNWKYNVKINKHEIVTKYDLNDVINFLIIDKNDNLLFKTNTMEVKNIDLVIDSLKILLCQKVIKK